jgi:hypothetical protein
VPDSGVLLGEMITLFVGTFVWLTWLTHARFGTFGFDLGIFDQGVWLLSRLRDPVVTIRGLPLFGDHEIQGWKDLSPDGKNERGLQIMAQLPAPTPGEPTKRTPVPPRTQRRRRWSSGSSSTR